MIGIDNLRYGIGEFSLDVSLSVRPGEYFVLLGMTGSGKTLLLENICGLRKCAAGNIAINGRDVTDAQPRERGIGYVPQDGALFQNMDVADNIAFALRVAGAAKVDRKREAERFAALLGITPILRRKIKGLSGGERQRVALARALAAHPAALLLDEPVSALDECTRQSVCNTLKALQRETGLPVLHVCHSTEEARLMADRIGVMQNGRLIESGVTDRIFDAPSTLAVARLLRLENIFQAEVREVDSESSEVVVAGQILKSRAGSGNKHIALRSDLIHVFTDSVIGTFDNVMAAKVVEMTGMGPMVRLRTEGRLPLTLYLSPREVKSRSLTTGQSVQLAFSRDAVHFLEDSLAWLP